MDKKIKPPSKPKYSVAQSKKLGRYMVAAKNLAVGELILYEDALAVGPTVLDYTGVFCFACMRPLPGYDRALKSRHTCSKCNVAPLCNRMCESAAGQLHSARECDLFRANKELYLENLEDLLQILLHLRLWLLKDDDGEAWSKVARMEAHLDERRNTPIWQEREKTVVEVFRKFGLSSGLVDDSVQWLCGVVDVNTFELRPPGGPEALLRGLFPEASLMAHTCRATTHVAVDERFRMSVYAALPVDAGQPITFNYTSSLLGTIERQEHLQNGKYFRCECSVCKDPLENGSYMSCIACPRCRKGYVAIQKPSERQPYSRKAKWQCQKCKRIFKGCLVKSAIDIGNSLIEQIDNDDLKGMESLLEKLSRTFHKNHYVLLALKQNLLSVYRNELSTVNPQRKILHKMLELAKEVLDVLEIVEPGISRLKGIMLYELHLPVAILANRAYGSREIKSSELVARLEEARDRLKRALTMLILEPASTPEGLLARRALQEMKALTQSLEDARALAAADDDAQQQTRPRRAGKNRGRANCRRAGDKLRTLAPTKEHV